jgi:protein O-GlcNAcase/histone acetyltransferase
MDRWQLGGSGYLETVGRQLDADIDILWTGPEIVSREIPVESILALQARLRRPPVIWDNLHANDYDGRRLYCGPYSGRRRELRSAVRGILSNPNTEFPVNYVAIRTLAAYLQGEDDWQPRAAYLEALQHWLGEFASVRAPLPLEDLTLLADCYYLPYEEGPEAERLLALLQRLVGEPPSAWGEAHRQFIELNGRIQHLFERLTELRHRELFYAWSRRAWDLKEEMQLFDLWLTARQQHPDALEGYASEAHLPGTCRGGLLARMQRLLPLGDDGRFRPSPPPGATPGDVRSCSPS